MHLRVFVEPQQGTTYERLMTLALEAERLGFDAFFSSDHYQRFGEGDPLPGPTDAWTTLAGLARDTTTIRLGTLITPVTFRRPGPLAIAVAQVDSMSHGRIELGLGAGWFETEHTAHGIPFHTLGQRFDMLEEQLAVITGMWTAPAGEQFSFVGDHYTLTDSPSLPKPIQNPHPPILMGGFGPKRTPRLAATYAQEFNTPFVDANSFDDARARVAAACESIGRDPASMIYSAAQVLCCGSDEAELSRRAAAIGREVSDLRASVIAGTPEECVAKIRSFGDKGATRVYLQVLDDTDLDHIALVASEVMPYV